MDVLMDNEKGFPKRKGFELLLVGDWATLGERKEAAVATDGLVGLSERLRIDPLLPFRCNSFGDFGGFGDCGEATGLGDFGWLLDWDFGNFSRVVEADRRPVIVVR